MLYRVRWEPSLGCLTTFEAFGVLAALFESAASTGVVVVGRLIPVSGTRMVARPLFVAVATLKGWAGASGSSCTDARGRLASGGRAGCTVAVPILIDRVELPVRTAAIRAGLAGIGEAELIDERVAGIVPTDLTGGARRGSGA